MKSHSLNILVIGNIMSFIFFTYVTVKLRQQNLIRALIAQITLSLKLSNVTCIRKNETKQLEQKRENYIFFGKSKTK